MTKLRLAGVLTAIALLVALMGSALTVSAQGVTVLTGYVTFSGEAAPSGTHVRVVDADGNEVARAATGAGGLMANQYRIDISLTSGDPLSGAMVSLQALTGGGLTDDMWVPAAGAVTVTIVANQVIMQNIDSDAEPPGDTGISRAALEEVVRDVVNGMRNELRGPQGPPGRNGTDGNDGMDGEDGADGSDGGAGPAGPRGATGGQGPQGPEGEQGPPGNDGSDGVAGPRGATGNTGPEGPQGIAGPQGGQGGQGPPGTNGADGEDASAVLAIVALIIAIVAAVAAGASVMMSQRS